MTSEREDAEVGAGRMPHRICMRFEWMSFSGLMRLSGPEGLVPAGASFFGALPSDAERRRVRAALERAAERGERVALTCRVAVGSVAGTFLLEGEAVRGDRALAPRVVGRLVEEPEGPRPQEVGPPGGVMRLLAGMLGELEEGGASPPPRGAQAAREADA